jgi:integrase
MESVQGKGKVNMKAIGREGVEKLSLLIERMWYYSTSLAKRRDAVIMGAGLLGLRWVEVSRVLVKDVVEEGNTLRVRTAKKGRRRTIVTGKSWGFGAKCIVMQQTCGNPDGLLFTTRNGTAVSYEQVLRRCKEWTRRATGEEFTFHSLRHSFAVSMYEKGMDVLEISRALGHKSLQWTSVYLATIVPCETVGGVGFTKDGAAERTLRVFNPEEERNERL